MTQTINFDPEVVSAIVETLREMPGALLPILHEVQARLGYVPDAAIGVIASGLNLSRAEVHGVVSYYHHFATEPRGRHIIEVCRAESCQAMGGRAIEAHARQSLGLDWYETSEDGEFTLEPIYCLGHCACSPAVRVGKQMFGRITAERFDEVVAELKTAPEASS